MSSQPDLLVSSLLKLVESDGDLRRAAGVMAQLRTHLGVEELVRQMQRQRAAGYQVAVVEEQGRVRAVAGFRITENLVSGKHLYVDDLVTDEASRSHGHGGRLLQGLAELARKAGCATLELDSGVQRESAHRFYFREGMHISSFHFRRELDLGGR